MATHAMVQLRVEIALVLGASLVSAVLIRHDRTHHDVLCVEAGAGARIM